MLFINMKQREYVFNFLTFKINGNIVHAFVHIPYSILSSSMKRFVFVLIVTSYRFQNINYWCIFLYVDIVFRFLSSVWFYKR